MPIIIYGLIDPKTQELRYVGKTKRPLNVRLRQHINDKRRSHRTSWIKSLLSDGYEPEIFEIEATEEGEWAEAERFWISYFRFLGSNLTNLGDGGEGNNGIKHWAEWNQKISQSHQGIGVGKKLSEEHKRKIGAAHKGMKRPPGTGKKISASLKGKVRVPHTKEQEEKRLAAIQVYWQMRREQGIKASLSEEHKKRISANKKEEYKTKRIHPITKRFMPKEGDGRSGIEYVHPTPETRRKLSLAHTGRVPSEETRKKIGLAHKGKKVSEETRRKLSEAHKGHVVSDETKKKMSISQKKRGFTISSEHREKLVSGLSAYRQARCDVEIKKRPPLSEDHKRAISNSMKKHHQSKRDKENSSENIYKQ